jgi:hypothetical protein
VRRARALGTIAAGATVVAVLASAPAAWAATIGADIHQTPTNGFGCGTTTCLVLVTRFATGEARAPFDGVITTWRLHHGTTTQPLKLRLRVAKRAGSGKWRFLRSTKAHTIPTNSTGISRFHAHTKVEKGDFLAIEMYGDAPAISVPAAAQRDVEWFPAPALGDTSPTAPDYHDRGYEHLWNATIKSR